MALLANELIPIGIAWTDEYDERPGVYTYGDGDTAVIGVSGLDNIVELDLDVNSLSRLINELVSIEEEITRD